MTTPATEISETFGLWQRSLIAWPDGREDRTTFAAWLQGPSLFADLRQPAGAPSFEGVSCLDHLEADHLDWLARQEGFAGRFVRAGSAFEWQRTVDFQCPNAATDAGYLTFVDGVLIEEGRDHPYIEHWHLASREVSPHFALRLVDAHGADGFLVRAGAYFMFVRGRASALPHGDSLLELVKGSSLADARALVDCEISFGRVDGGAWRIARSSLPYRAGGDLGPQFAADGGRLTIADIARDGTPISPSWTVIEFDTAQQQDASTGQGSDQDFTSFHPAIGRSP